MMNESHVQGDTSSTVLHACTRRPVIEWNIPTIDCPEGLSIRTHRKLVVFTQHCLIQLFAARHVDPVLAAGRCLLVPGRFGGLLGGRREASVEVPAAQLPRSRVGVC